MPSRCIFFFSALSAWSILLSRTMICKAKAPNWMARLIPEAFCPVHLLELTFSTFDRLPPAPHISVHDPENRPHGPSRSEPDRRPGSRPQGAGNPAPDQ